MVVPLTGALVIASGAMFALVRFFGEAPPARSLEAAVGAGAFGAVIAAPGVLALLASIIRPVLLLPAAAILLPLSQLSVLSFAPVTLPLLVPAVLLVRLAVAPGIRAASATLLVLALLFAALLALFSSDDPRTFTSSTSTYETSDVVTYTESAVSLALVGLALTAGWTLGTRPGARHVD